MAYFWIYRMKCENIEWSYWDFHSELLSYFHYVLSVCFTLTINQQFFHWTLTPAHVITHLMIVLLSLTELIVFDCRSGCSCCCSGFCCHVLSEQETGSLARSVCFGRRPGRDSSWRWWGVFCGSSVWAPLSEQTPVWEPWDLLPQRGKRGTERTFILKVSDVYLC